MKKILVLAGCLACCNLVAKLGETEDQIETRYGTPRNDSLVNGLPTRFYTFNSFRIGVSFFNHKSVAEFLTPVADDRRLGDDECLTLIKAIAGDGEWKRDFTLSAVFKPVWANGTNCYAQKEIRVIGSDCLYVFSADYLGIFMAKRAKEQSETAKAFGDPIESRAKEKAKEAEEQKVRDDAFDKVQFQARAREQQARIDRAEAASRAAAEKRREVDIKILKSQQERAAAGYASSQYDLGMRYLKGQGVPQDKVLAFEWLQKAAAQDHAEAKAALAKLQTHSNP